MKTNHYLTAAQNMALIIPNILIAQGLDPQINRFVLTESERGDTWLFAVLNDSILEYPSSYGDPRILSHLSAAFQGLRVVFSNGYGLRYAFLLSPPELLPETISDNQHSLLK